jgi:DNA primase
MARDIEEFLRKAAERRQQQKGGQQPPPKQPSRQQPPRRQQPAQQRPQQPIIIEDVEVVQSRPVSQPKPPRQQLRKQPNIRNESVADHVKSHIDTSSIARHAENLGDRIVSVHDEVDKRIHKRLDHDITVIDDTPTITDNPSPAIFGKRTSLVAGDIRELLQDPKSVGQAILVAEILKRPNF